MLAVVEAKPAYKLPGDGLQQAKDYAEVLGVKFAYSTNGYGIVEFDYTTGKESEMPSFPAPDELWQRYREGWKRGRSSFRLPLLHSIVSWLKRRVLRLALCLAAAPEYELRPFV
jgi:hypothetical protein